MLRMLCRTPRDPTKPPRMCSIRTAIAIPVIAVVLAATSEVFYSWSVPVPGNKTGSYLVLAQVGTKFADLDRLTYSVHMQCLCRDGKYAEKRVEVALTELSNTRAICFEQRAFALNADRAVFLLFGRDCRLPFLHHYCVGYDILSFRSAIGHLGALAESELENWVRTGPFVSAPVYVVIPSQNQATPFSTTSFPVDLVISGITGIAALYLIPVMLMALVVRWGLRCVQWHVRRKKGLCVQCKYQLAGIPSGVCPECGTPRVGTASSA